MSLNSCAIRTIAEIGPTTVIGYARKFGIESPLTNTLSLSLGSSDLTLIEMVRAFGVLANRGIRTKPFSILRIEDGSGRIIKQNLSEEEDVLSEQTCYVMTNMLKGVIEEGTGVYAKDVIRRPAAGKTGTTNDFTDAWFIGYTPQIVCGVWVGYDDKMTLGKKNSGGVIACPIWAHFIRRAFKGKEQVDFPVPLTGVTSVNIDGNTGYLATPNSKNEYNEAFLSGTEPKVSLICPTTDQIVNKVEEGEDEVIQTALEKPDTTEEKPQENSSENLQESTGTIHQ